MDEIELGEKRVPFRGKDVLEAETRSGSEDTTILVVSRRVRTILR